MKSNPIFTMIKLIASDLDGTLLLPNGQLPQNAFDVITPIVERGVLFIPASGRQYESLKILFAPLIEKSPFICENGALVAYMGRTIHLDPLPVESAKRIVLALQNEPKLHLIVCGEQTAFFQSDYQTFVSKASVAYPKNKKVDCLLDVLQEEPCCKIAIYSEDDARTQGYPAVLPHLDGNLSAILSGGHWCDVMSKTANKGNAMRAVQKLLSVTPDECIAFGDHLNDLELLSACGKTFAPQNAQPEIRAVANEIIPSNADMGVLFTLKRLLHKGVI